MKQVAEDIMSLLRSATSELHSSTAAQTFQTSLGKGELSREDYIHWLGQMYHLHHTLESGLRKLIDSNSIAASIVDHSQFKLPMLMKDLAFFDSAPDKESPLPATETAQKHVEHLAQSSPIALLGSHYVLEGSTNGNSFAARPIRANFHIMGDSGASYLDPYGEDQRGKWKQFKERMNEASFSQIDTDLIVQAGVDMFHHLAQMGEALTDQSTSLVM